jgi:hypothetical protein
MSIYEVYANTKEEENNHNLIFENHVQVYQTLNIKFLILDHGKNR